MVAAISARNNLNELGATGLWSAGLSAIANYRYYNLYHSQRCQQSGCDRWDGRRWPRLLWPESGKLSLDILGDKKLGRIHQGGYRESVRCLRLGMFYEILHHHSPEFAAAWERGRFRKDYPV